MLDSNTADLPPMHFAVSDLHPTAGTQEPVDFVGAAQAGVNTNRHPWSTIVHLEVHYDYDGKADGYGSGVMIGTNDVLTQGSRMRSLW